MRSLVVVVPYILVEDPLKMATTPDQHPIQTLLSYRLYPPLGERVGVRRLDGRLDDLGAVGGEHVVEGTGELAVPVANEEARRSGTLRSFPLPPPSRTPVPAGLPKAHSGGA